jgi:hypothetical protein
MDNFNCCNDIVFRGKWENNFMTDLRDIIRTGVVWIRLTQPYNKTNEMR